jgi:nicotinate-nucleotide pyrophosphorylase (carboxylating)
VTVRELDTVEVLTAVMEALKQDLADGPDLPDVDMPREAVTGTAVIRATESGMLGGLPVARETYRRLGVRMRPLKEEGSALAAGDRAALVGGSVKAILTGRRTALRFLERLSAIASGAVEPDPTDPLEAYAASLRDESATPSVGQNGPRFELEVEG